MTAHCSIGSVLIVEYGYFDDSPAQVEPSSAYQYLAKNLFNVTSVAQPGVGNRQATIYAASVVGGGSTVNGMLFDRGSADDYNNWEKLGNPGWGWSGLLPYFKKVSSVISCHQNSASMLILVLEYQIHPPSG